MRTSDDEFTLEFVESVVDELINETTSNASSESKSWINFNLIIYIYIYIFSNKLLTNKYIIDRL